MAEGSFVFPGQRAWVAEHSSKNWSPAAEVAVGRQKQWHVVPSSVTVPVYVSSNGTLGSWQWLVYQFSAWVGPETLGLKTW